MLSGHSSFRYDDGQLHSYRCAGFTTVRQTALQTPKLPPPRFSTRVSNPVGDAD